MSGQVVQQEDISRPHLWQQQLIDKGVEDRVVNAACEQQRGDHAAQPEAADQRMVRPSLKRDTPDDACPTRGTPEGARKSQVKARFVSEDEPAAVNTRHLLPEGETFLLIPFVGGERLFFRGSPKRCRARQMVEG